MSSSRKLLSSEEFAKAFKVAEEARQAAYCPYSKFQVGCALVCEDGTIFKGCNIENASYPLTNCAERVAIGTAVTNGHKNFKAVVVCVGGGKYGTDRIRKAEDLKWPCGACRQVINEFGCNISVYSAASTELYIVKNISELLPVAFGPSDLLN